MASFKEYKQYAGNLLDFTLFTYILLFFVSISFYFAAFDRNIANTTPLMLVLMLGILTWALRYRLVDAEDTDRIRALLVQWTIVSLLGVIFLVIVVLVYPIS